MNSDTFLWTYIVLLVAGGMVGFLKAKSKASLITSLAFAVGLSLSAAGLFGVETSRVIANTLLAVLMIFFGVRFATTKRFMPAGLMTILTILTLALTNLLRIR